MNKEEIELMADLVDNLGEHNHLMEDTKRRIAQYIRHSTLSDTSFWDTNAPEFEYSMIERTSPIPETNGSEFKVKTWTLATSLTE